LKSQVTFSSGLSKDNIDEEKSDEKNINIVEHKSCTE